MIAFMGLKARASTVSRLARLGFAPFVSRFERFWLATRESRFARLNSDFEAEVAELGGGEFSGQVDRLVLRQGG